MTCDLVFYIHGLVLAQRPLLTDIPIYAIIIAMDKRAKPIRLSEHAKNQLVSRGATEKEIAEAVGTAEWSRAELGRFECRKDFVFNKTWNGMRYKSKQVRPIFADEQNEIIVITVYTYYF